MATVEVTLESLLQEMLDKIDQLEQKVQAIPTETRPETDLGPIESRVSRLESQGPLVQKVVERVQVVREASKVPETQTPRVDLSPINDRINQLTNRLDEMAPDHDIDLKKMRYRLKQPDGSWSPWYNLMAGGGGGGLSTKRIQQMINEAVQLSIDTLSEQIANLQAVDPSERLDQLIALLSETLVQAKIANIHNQSITGERVHPADVPDSQNISGADPL